MGGRWEGPQCAHHDDEDQKPSEPDYPIRTCFDHLGHLPRKEHDSPLDSQDRKLRRRPYFLGTAPLGRRTLPSSSAQPAGRSRYVPT